MPAPDIEIEAQRELNERADVSGALQEAEHPAPGVAAHGETAAPVCAQSNSTIVTGWLSKSRRWRFVPWSEPMHQRWFSFDPRTVELAYFLSDKHSVPYRVLAIQSCEVEMDTDGSSTSFGFFVRPRNSPSLSLFAASEAERNSWVRAIQDALALKQVLLRSCSPPRPLPSPSDIPENAEPAQQPSPQRPAASTRYNASLNYQLTLGGVAAPSPPEFIPENYCLLVQDKRCESRSGEEVVGERHVPSGERHVPSGTPTHRVLHIPQSSRFVAEECVGMNPSTKEFFIVEAAHAGIHVAASSPKIKGSSINDGKNDGTCVAGKSFESSHAIDKQTSKSPLPSGDVPAPQTPPRMQLSARNSFMSTLSAESPASSEENSSEDIIFRRSIRSKALRKAAPVPLHDTQALESAGRDGAIIHEPASEISAARDGAIVDEPASEISSSVDSVSPVSIENLVGAASAPLDRISTLETYAKGGGGKKPAKRPLFPEDRSNVTAEQHQPYATQGIKNRSRRLNCHGEVAHNKKEAISNHSLQANMHALSGMEETCSAAQAAAVGHVVMSGTGTVAASDKRKHPVKLKSLFGLSRWWEMGRNCLEDLDEKIDAQTPVMSSSTGSTIREQEPDYLGHGKSVIASHMNTGSKISTGEASSTTSKVDTTAMSSVNAESIQEVIDSLKVAMDLKSQKSPRSNRSTPFTSPKVQPRPRNTQASPIPMRKTPSAAYVHPQNTQKAGSCLEEDLTIAKTPQAHGMPVQLTTKPLQRASTAAAPSPILKNVSGGNTQSRTAGITPPSWSRTICSSLLASPPNSPSGPDPPDVPSACLENENLEADDHLDEIHAADRKSTLCYSQASAPPLVQSRGRSQVHGSTRVGISCTFLRFSCIVAILALFIGMLDRMRPLDDARVSVSLQGETANDVGRLPQIADLGSESGSSISRHNHDDFKPDVLQKLIFSLMASPSSMEASEEMASEWTTASPYQPGFALQDGKTSAGSNGIEGLVGTEFPYKSGVIDYVGQILKTIHEKVRLWLQLPTKDWLMSTRDGPSQGVGFWNDTLIGFLIGVFFMLAVHLVVDRPAGGRRGKTDHVDKNCARRSTRGEVGRVT